MALFVFPLMKGKFTFAFCASFKNRFYTLKIVKNFNLKCLPKKTNPMKLNEKVNCFGCQMREWENWKTTKVKVCVFKSMEEYSAIKQTRANRKRRVPIV